MICDKLMNTIFSQFINFSNKIMILLELILIERIVFMNL